MTRIGEALRRVHEGGTADPVARELAPAWVQPALASTAENLWTFEPTAPAVPAVDAPYPGRAWSCHRSTTTAAERPGSRWRLLSSVPRSRIAGQPADRWSGSSRSGAYRLTRSNTTGVWQRPCTRHRRDRGVKVVMITSALVGEGKSLTAANLALTLSESYRRRVLLVDADLRRPGLHDIFQVSSNDGLSDGLRRARNSTFTTFQLSSTLTMLPAGRPDRDPMASLTSPRMTAADRGGAPQVRLGDHRHASGHADAGRQAPRRHGGFRPAGGRPPARRPSTCSSRPSRRIGRKTYSRRDLQSGRQPTGG